jgi:small conductance mechanosensitive channel
MKDIAALEVPSLVLAAAAFALAAFVVWLGRRFVNRLVATLDLGEAAGAAIRTRARQAVGALAIAAFGIAAITGLSLALSRAGLEAEGWTPRQVASWLVSHGVRILIIVAGAYVTLRGVHLSIEYVTQRAGRQAGVGDAEWRRRAATLGSILSSLVSALVFFLGGLMVLRELSIDVVPLLTGAGIAGLALGFGAQNLVRDVISGFFLIVEDQVGVGDLARIGSVTGVVEEIKLRTIVLRDADGAVHVFPNGTVTTIANLSKDFSYATVDVVVMHGERLDRVLDALRAIGAGLRADPAFGDGILGDLDVLGVQELRQADLTVRVQFKTVPLRQFRIAAELRRRIAVSFTARGIRPFGPG